MRRSRRLGWCFLALWAPGSTFMAGLLKGRRPSAQSTKQPEQDLASPAQQTALKELEESWRRKEKELRKEYPDMEKDPFFHIDRTSLLHRYLSVTGFDAKEALGRLVQTARWRRDWDMLSYYEPGAGTRLFSESSNPGSEMYFADSLHLDRVGRPILAGRVRFANAENMHPWNHLRAGVFVFELLATKVAQLGRGPGTYILDIGPVGGQAGNVSGTGGLDRDYDESINPYYKAGAGSKDAPSAEMLEEFGSLDNGFAVLKAAIQILNRHYPGVISRVYYLHSDMIFWGAFKIFSRWVADRGSIDFQFLGEAGWREEPVSKLLETIAPEELFEEWGGSGPRLDGDQFLVRALNQYEIDAKKGSVLTAAGR